MKRLLLAGSGHAQLEVLRRIAASPLPGVEVALVNPTRHWYYSGMLPGLVAGHYRADECAIDVAALAARAGARFVRAGVQRLAATRGEVELDDGSPLAFELISLNVGSVPDWADIPGAREHAVPVRPFAGVVRWVEEISRAPPRDLLLAGGGAAGVELALALAWRLRAHGEAKVRLVTDQADVLAGFPVSARKRATRQLAAAGIEVATHARAARVDAGMLHCADVRAFRFDHLLWCTGAAAPEWLAASGVATDPRGFAAVLPTLQSTSHANVFAAGDAATLIANPCPKSGVYAVRQGPVLADNLRAACAGQPLRDFRPQAKSLALISTGARHAIAARGALVFEGDWVWRWKDHIDRNFLARYR